MLHDQPKRLWLGSEGEGPAEDVPDLFSTASLYTVVHRQAYHSIGQVFGMLEVAANRARNDDWMVVAPDLQAILGAGCDNLIYVKRRRQPHGKALPRRLLFLPPGCKASAGQLAHSRHLEWLPLVGVP